MLGTSGLQQYPMYVVIIGKIGDSGTNKSFDFIPNGETQLARLVLQQRLIKMAGRGLPTNNIPAVMAAAAGYNLCTVSRSGSGHPTPPPDLWIGLGPSNDLILASKVRLEAAWVASMRVRIFSVVMFRPRRFRWFLADSRSRQVPMASPRLLAAPAGA